MGYASRILTTKGSQMARKRKGAAARKVPAARKALAARRRLEAEARALAEQQQLVLGVLDRPVDGQADHGAEGALPRTRRWSSSRNNQGHSAMPTSGGNQ